MIAVVLEVADILVIDVVLEVVGILVTDVVERRTGSMNLMRLGFVQRWETDVGCLDFRSLATGCWKTCCVASDPEPEIGSAGHVRLGRLSA